MPNWGLWTVIKYVPGTAQLLCEGESAGGAIEAIISDDGKIYTLRSLDIEFELRKIEPNEYPNQQ